MVDNESGSGIGGYFSLSFTEIEVCDDHQLNKSVWKRIVKSNKKKNTETIKAYLIGQLSKDDSFGQSLSLEKIMDEVLGIVVQARDLVAGRVLLLECSDCEKLQQRYKDVGFMYLQKSDGELNQMYKIF